MTQRIWPDRQIDLTDYLDAHHSASGIRRASLDDQPPWLPVGPRNIGGRMTDIVGHPSDAQHFYVAAASGGIFKTTNGGTDWIPIFDDAPGMSMGALAIDLSHPDTVYAGPVRRIRPATPILARGCTARPMADSPGATWV